MTQKFFDIFRTVTAFFGGHGSLEIDPAIPTAPSSFIRRYAADFRALGLTASPLGFAFQESKTYEGRGLVCELHADAVLLFRDIDFESPELKKAESARLWLARQRDDLAFKVRFSLSQAEAAINALADLVLRPSELKWLGGEEAARQRYLGLPARATAADAVANSRRLHKEAQANAAVARNKVLEQRLHSLTPARLVAKNIQCRYREDIPFLTSSLELELTVEKALEHRDAERLLEAKDADFPATVETVLTHTRKQLKARVEEQLSQLARRIVTLPHVDLLADPDIAAIVAPYYGGLNRALKKHRAKSALVAVEESAREAKYQDDLAKLNEQRSAYADVATYYPLARSMNRELILFTGPTNSGKTWRALNALAEAESGAYLAPLRLLALEGQEELEKRGRPTSFLTGEERDVRPEARFISSTIEMLDLSTPVGAVVIDEVQLLADERRGWAWLAALVGAPAHKVIMTGSPDCIEIVKDLASYLGETLTIHECQRHNELRVAPSPMRLREIRPGMAIVCFSRRDVLRIKNTIQENSDHKVAVVYGNLSPQTRREEARRFRSGEADILVATDAIAMGLNLPIMEVLFYATEKFNGEEMCQLTQAEIRQIGGRAGRHGFAQFGVVNALNTKSLSLIREALAGTTETLKPPYYVAPGPNHVAIISEVLGTKSLERILTFFERAIEFSDERFARSNIDELSYLSTFVDQRLPFLDVTTRLKVACAPVALRNETVLDWFLNRMLAVFTDPDDPHAEPDHLDDLFEAARRFERGAASSQLALRDAEDYLKTLTVYAWLAYRFPDVFTRIEDCEEHREAVNAFVERSLRKTPDKARPDSARPGADTERPQRQGGRGRRRRR